MAEKIKVLFAASECAPMVKVGGLGDVIGSLPKALAKFNIFPAIILPRYEIIKTGGLRKTAHFEVIFKNKKEPVSIYKGFLPKSRVPIFYVENNRYLSRGGPIYFSRNAIARDAREFERFHFFSHAVYELLENNLLPFSPDIVHAHDWHTGVLVELLNGSEKELPTVFSIHNLGNQGVYRGRNSIAEGIRNAGAVATVSPSYAEEIQTREYGAGLEQLLKTRQPVGVLNGIDYSALKKRFHKARVKIDLQKKLKLVVGTEYPLFGLVARLAEQKGIHLITPLVSEMVRKYKAQFIFLGVGEKKYEEALIRLAGRYPKNISAKIEFDEELADNIYIASDFFLMPSLFEPCGLGQMIAMHYGTLPVVRATGGLKDTVREGETGFVFHSKKSSDLAKAMKGGIAVFHSLKRLDKMRENCRKKDFSWERSAAEYVKLYDDLL